MTREQFLINLMKYIKTPYLWNGKNPILGLDCSGLVWNILKDLNIGTLFALNSQQLMEHYSPTSHVVLPDQSDLGDLVFFGNSTHIHHVGFCLNKTLMIEAAHGDETVTSVEIANTKGAFVTVSPIHKFKDIFVILRPLNLPWAEGSLQSQQPS